MTLVLNAAEVDMIRPYKEYELTVYPKKYPAFIDFVYHDGGLGGGYYTLELLEIPKKPKRDMVKDPFLAGFCAAMEAKPQTYSENIFRKRKLR